MAKANPGSHRRGAGMRAVATAVPPEFRAVQSAFSRRRDVVGGQLMASYGLKVKGKIFAILNRGRLVVKLPKHRVDILVAGGKCKRFDPGHGRIMKEWVVIGLDRWQWPKLAQEACEFVSSGNKPRG